MSRVSDCFYCLVCLLVTTTVAAQPRFSRQHMLVDGAKSISVAIEDSEGGTIRYTTDGSTPTRSSRCYTEPLQLRETTVLRAVEERGEELSAVTTASYIFIGSVLGQPNNPKGYPELWGEFCQISGRAIADYEMDPEMTSDPGLQLKIVEGLRQLPILSIVTDRDNLFGHERDEERGGIYIFTGPPVGDNTGHGWTRPASVELFGGASASLPSDYASTIDLSTTCGLRLHGGHGRLAEKNPKHSFRLVFKDEYGPKTLKYPVFGEDGPERFNQLVVRCHFGNSWQHWDRDNRRYAQYTRDVWARLMQRRISGIGADALYVNLFLNGMYWGVYNVAERVDDHFGKEHLGGRKEEIDVIKIEEDGGNHLEASEGTLDAWNLMNSVAAKASNRAAYEQLDTLLNKDCFIDYMIINQYIGSTDWDHHNWYAIRRHNNDSVKSDGFRFLCWDSEVIFEDVHENLAKGSAKKGYPTTLFRNLLKNADFARRYVRRAKELLTDDGLLGERSVVALWDSLYYSIDKALYAEAARWGDYRRDVHRWKTAGDLYTVETYYLPERNRLLNDYFPYRSRIVLSDILSNVNIDDTDGVALHTVAKRQDDHRYRYYNLHGQIVEHPRDGAIYIRDGKKILYKSLQP